jgi:hypothetical protein
MNQKKKRLYWNLCSLAVVVLCILALSPLVLPPGQIEPAIASLPRALWAGILIYCGIVVLTIIAIRVDPDDETDEGGR